MKGEILHIKKYLSSCCSLCRFTVAFFFLLSSYGAYSQTFPCDSASRLYFFQDSGANGSLAYFSNYTTATPTVTTLFQMPTGSHNGLGANTVDQYLYYQNGTTLTRLDAAGTATPVCNLTFSSVYGCFDPMGRYWTFNGSNLVAIDITACAVVKGPYPILTGGGFLDLVFNPYDCMIYFSDKRCDTSGVVDATYSGTIFTPAGTYGGVAVGTNGNMYGVAGGGLSGLPGNLSSINLALGTSANVFNFGPGPTYGRSDMASFICWDIIPAIAATPSGCAPTNINFTDQSVGSVNTWSWNFGDPLSGVNNTSTLQNPSHTYNNPGTYTVTLNLTGGNKLCPTFFMKDSTFMVVTVSAGFTVTATGTNANCSNNGTATAVATGGTAPFTYLWNSSGQTTQTASALAQGSYTVTITDANGCTNTATVQVNGTAGLTATISATPANCVAVGSATVTTGSGTAPFTYQWNNGQTAPIATGLSAGTYTVIIIDASGCRDTLTQTISTTGGPPTAAIIPPVAPPCLGGTLSLSDGSIMHPGDPITSWSWLMPGGSPSSATTQNTSTLYNTAGPHTVTLLVISAAGCVDTVIQQVLVYDNPVANFSAAAAGCAPVCTGYTDLSTSASGNITGWNWSFPGGSPGFSLSQNPDTICYTTPGTYGATLIVTNVYGCKDTVTLNSLINVYPQPKADFCVTPTTAPATDPVFTFCDLWSSDVLKWTWYFGDGDSDNVQTDPVHSYSASVGSNDFYTYNVCLRVQNQYGCLDSICKTVEVLPEYTFYMPNTFTPNRDNTNDLFFGKGRGIKKYEIWLFDRWGNQLWDCRNDETNTSTAWDSNGQDGLSSYCKWDGTVQKGGPDMNGGSRQLVQQDVYVWKVKLVDIFDKKHSYVGHVAVVR